MAVDEMRRARSLILLLLAACSLLGVGDLAMSEESWNPFRESDAARTRKSASSEPAPPDRPYLAPMDGKLHQGAPPLDAKSQAVERADLGPIMAGDGPGLPLELWQGLDPARAEQLMATLDIPTRSPALNGLWRRLLTARAGLGPGPAAQLAALRAEALYRSGLLREAAEALAAAGEEPVATVIKARVEIALASRDAGCASIRSAAARKAELPKRLKGEALLIAGYCAGAGSNPGGAGLAAELAREEGVDAPLAVSALDALAVGQMPRLQLPRRIGVLDYRLLQLAGAVDPAAVLERADAPLLAALIWDGSVDGKLRLAAAEAGARLNVIDAVGLADIYRAQSFAPSELAEPLAGRPDPLLRRALLFKAAEGERTPLKRTRVVRALLDDARRSGTYLHTLRMLTKAADEIERVAEIGWFAETAVEIAVAAGRHDAARAWVAFARAPDRPAAGSLDHWLALIDIADPDLQSKRGQSLASVEQLALGGRFGSELLHRLATVLDALDYNVPIPLWDAANRAPQPAGGHLPETGVLPELLDASRKREPARTVLLAMRTLGPNGADGAHMIALGDAVRALKRAGLEPDARRVAFEALFPGWPRGMSN
jgi:hypothetical protein